jgi:hypothetical protein
MPALRLGSSVGTARRGSPSHRGRARTGDIARSVPPSRPLHSPHPERQPGSHRDRSPRVLPRCEEPAGPAVPVVHSHGTIGDTRRDAEARDDDRNHRRSGLQVKGRDTRPCVPCPLHGVRMSYRASGRDTGLRVPACVRTFDWKRERHAAGAFRSWFCRLFRPTLEPPSGSTAVQSATES